MRRGHGILSNVPPPPLPSGAPSSSSSHAPIAGQPTVRGTDDRPLEPFDFPGVQWQRTDPWAENYWLNHMELRNWMENGWHDDTERFGIGIIDDKTLNSYHNWYALQLTSVEIKSIF